jgi:hypothetical protein
MRTTPKIALAVAALAALGFLASAGYAGGC